MPVRALLFVGIGLIPALGAAQGLGGVARKEADRRARAPVPAESRSYTNADLRIDEETDEPGDGDSTSQGPARQPAAFEEGRRTEDSGGATYRAELDRLREQLDRASTRRKERERTWRARVAAARANLAAAQKDHEVACNPGSIALRGG